MTPTSPGPIRPFSDVQSTQGGVSRAIVVAASFFRRHLWVWPVLLAVVLGGIAYWVQRSLEETIKTQLAGDLQGILKADVDALKLWLDSRVGEAEAFGIDPQINRLAKSLIARTDTLAEFNAETLGEDLGKLQAYMQPRLKAMEYDDFFIVDTQLRVVASKTSAAIGRKLSDYRKTFFAEIIAGTAKTSIPFQSVLQVTDESGKLRAGVPTMLTAAPMRDDAKVFAALAFRIRPHEEFSKILGLARFGQTGETYAFSKDGIMLSESRFNADLKRVGLLPDGDDFRSTLSIKLRDPGVDLLAGEKVAEGVELPLTRMVTHCLENGEGIDVNGYRDYRGVPVVGAWTWLKEYDFGVATEAAKSEAFSSLRTLEVIFWVLFALLLLGGLVMLVLMIILDRRQAALRKAVLEMKRLGQYQLDDKLGSGGMGSVYRAHHDLMRRPTAVKLLDPHRISDLAIKRFEREVQLTARLTHPNTIAIYDFGRTPEGIFYYAMEYLDGLDLDGVVAKYGAQPEGRVIYILHQICGSLSEAHRENLIHRDIKPANVMLTDRGGCADFVKVLDFGLVKTVGEQESVVKAGGLQNYVGTAPYLAPEAIGAGGRVDHRSDLYAVGAIGYYLLTGSPPFPGKSDVEILGAALNDPLVPPSTRLGKPIQPDLEALVIRCLQRNPADRYQTAEELADALAGCAAFGTWTPRMARDW